MLTSPLLANVVVEFIVKGGLIMYPILVVGVVAACVVSERVFWWLRFGAKRRPKRLDEVYAALEEGDLPKAVTLSSASTVSHARREEFGGE